MAWQSTTRLHVSGYRFLRRRIECALLGRDVRAVDDPIRAPAQSMMAGLVCALTIFAGCVVLAFLRPQPGSMTGPILMEKRSGALYVRLGETLHPVLNLASARLIVKKNADPQPTAESVLSHSKRGPLLGIPGAPQFVGSPLGEDELRWTVCDSQDVTTVLVGPAEGQQPDGLAGDQALLVRPSSGGSTYLLYDGRRAVVNLDDAAVKHALAIEGQAPIRVSALLLNLIPETLPLTAPWIADVGSRGPASLSGFPVGSVLRVSRVGGDEYYLVLSDGVQRVGQFAADLVRFTNSQGTRTAIAVAPDVIRGAAPVTRLPVAAFPDRTRVAPIADGAPFCVGWTHEASGNVEISFSLGGVNLSDGHGPVALTQGDGPGPAVDAVYVPPGRCAYVRATGISGNNIRAGTRYLVSDNGVRYAVHDDDAARDLGLPDTMTAAPWPLLAALPAGPELSRTNASVAQDVSAVTSRSEPGSP